MKNSGGKGLAEDPRKLKFSFEHRPSKEKSSKSVGRHQPNSYPQDLSSLVPDFLARPKYGPLDHEAYHGDRDFGFPTSYQTFNNYQKEVYTPTRRNLDVKRKRLKTSGQPNSPKAKPLPIEGILLSHQGIDTGSRTENHQKTDNTHQIQPDQISSQKLSSRKAPRQIHQSPDFMRPAQHKRQLNQQAIV